MSEKGATVEGLKLAQTFLLTTRGTPLLYYGDELAMQGGSDPDNRRDFPGGFAGDERNAFTKAGRTAIENDVFEHVKLLARLRAELPALRRGSLIQLYDEEQQTVFARVLGGEAVVIALNNDTKPATFEFDAAAVNIPDGMNLSDRLGVLEGVTRIANGRAKVTLPARSACIFATQGNPPIINTGSLRSRRR
jgi:glycosidase